jgi:prepilin-type N-terminal cleavage/methylation domain-containing protein
MTLPEVLITIAIGLILMSFAGPSLGRARDRFAVQAARREIAATVEAARAASVQRGHAARFFVRTHSVVAIADTAAPGQPTSGTLVVLAPRSFDQAYGVKLSLAYSTDTAIVFDARGFANPRLNHVMRIAIVGRSTRDSVCISSFGQVLPANCTQ